MRGLMSTLRLTRAYRCGGGANLATEAEFEAQRAQAEQVLDWYYQYVKVLRRLMYVGRDAFGGGQLLRRRRLVGGRAPGRRRRPRHRLRRAGRVRAAFWRGELHAGRWRQLGDGLQGTEADEGGRQAGEPVVQVLLDSASARRVEGAADD